MAIEAAKGRSVACIKQHIQPSLGDRAADHGDLQWNSLYMVPKDVTAASFVTGFGFVSGELYIGVSHERGRERERDCPHLHIPFLSSTGRATREANGQTPTYVTKLCRSRTFHLYICSPFSFM